MYTFSKTLNFLFSDGNEIQINKQVGHLLRTKLSHWNEGSLSSGHGALDSVYLLDKEGS